METKLIILGYFILGMFFGYCIGFGIRGLKLEKKESKSKFPKCTCKDPNDCIIWCHAKESFKKDFNAGKI